MTTHKLEKGVMIEDPDGEWVRREEASPRWSKEPPTVPGHYLCKGLKGGIQHLQLFQRDITEGEIFIGWLDGGYVQYSQLTWFGPIPQPEEEL